MNLAVEGPLSLESSSYQVWDPLCSNRAGRRCPRHFELGSMMNGLAAVGILTKGRRNRNTLTRWPVVIDVSIVYIGKVAEIAVRNGV